MTAAKIVHDLQAPPRAASRGRRIWTMAALIFSILVLLLAVAGIVGTWVGRSEAIELVTDVTTGVDELASAARERIARVDPLLAEVRVVVGTVQTAADRASEDVADRGLLPTLLPPDTTQELEALGDRLRATLESILSVLQAAGDLAEAVRGLPFVDLPPPEETGAVQQEIEAIIAGIDQLEADIGQFREDVAGEIATVAATAAEIDGEVETAQKNLATLDGELVTLQLKANAFREGFPPWSTVTAVLLTVLFLWTGHAMVHLIRTYWTEWQAPHMETKTPLPPGVPGRSPAESADVLLEEEE